jgi:hypothetical protein
VLATRKIILYYKIKGLLSKIFLIIISSKKHTTIIDLYHFICDRNVMLMSVSGPPRQQNARRETPFKRDDLFGVATHQGIARTCSETI